MTKWNLVPPYISGGSRAWWVRTKTEVWKGGSLQSLERPLVGRLGRRPDG
jgi:hypothetical protein